ncbi:MAG: beta-phosphoglucomutase family hydrolase [bacterium]
MKLKAAIFNLDGVIVDTVPLHFSAWRRMFEEYGKNFTFENYKTKVDGIPRDDGVRAILPNLTSDEIREAGDRKQQYFLEYLNKSEVPVYKSTISLINQLKKNNIKAAVVSSSKNSPVILKKIGLYDNIDVVISGDAINIGKPDPQIFLMAASQLDVLPASCAVFEDAVLGVEAAKNAGMFCIGIDRYNEPERLKEANYIVKDLNEINLEKLFKLMMKSA